MASRLVVGHKPDRKNGFGRGKPKTFWKAIDDSNERPGASFVDCHVNIHGAFKAAGLEEPSGKPAAH